MEELERGRQVAEEARAGARDEGRDEEQQLVDETGLEERRRQRRAAFEQERLDALRGERAQLLPERAAAQLELRFFGQRAAPERESPGLRRGVDVAGVEAGRVRPHRPHPDCNGVGGSPQLVHAVHPRIAIMNNGAMKGGTKSTFEIVRSSPGIEDFWQLHYSLTDGKDMNSPDQFIATVESQPGHMGHYLKLSARKDGSFTVLNERTGFTKEYPAVRSAAPAATASR